MTETLDQNSTSFTREGGILHDDSGALFMRSLTPSRLRTTSVASSRTSTAWPRWPVGTEYWLPSTRTRLSVHGRHPVEPVRRGGRPQRAERLPLLGQEFPRDLPVGLRDLAVLLRTPGGALRAEIVVVDEGPPGQEVRLHKLD